MRTESPAHRHTVVAVHKPRFGPAGELHASPDAGLFRPRPDLSSGGDARRRAFQSAEGADYEVAIIGGGVTGAKLFHEFRCRGQRVLLLERGDFASGRWRLDLRDRLHGYEAAATARFVVNAAGVWTDSVNTELGIESPEIRIIAGSALNSIGWASIASRHQPASSVFTLNF